MKLVVGGDTHYFCSQHCLKKFAKEKDITKDLLNRISGYHFSLNDIKGVYSGAASLANMVLLYFNVGKRIAVWLPIITVPQVIIFGVIANIIF